MLAPLAAAKCLPQEPVPNEEVRYTASAPPGKPSVRSDKVHRFTACCHDSADFACPGHALGLRASQRAFQAAYCLSASPSWSLQLLMGLHVQAGPGPSRHMQQQGQLPGQLPGPFPGRYRHPAPQSPGMLPIMGAAPLGPAAHMARPAQPQPAQQGAPAHADIAACCVWHDALATAPFSGMPAYHPRSSATGHSS